MRTSAAFYFLALGILLVPWARQLGQISGSAFRRHRRGWRWSSWATLVSQAFLVCAGLYLALVVILSERS